MPVYPQYSGAKLVEFANIVAVTATTYSANPGDLVVHSGTTSLTITLPAIAVGGPVGVKQLGTAGAAVTIITTEGTNSNIDGIVGTTGTTCSVQYSSATFSSDGVSNWYRVAQ
jgi:hypothetical protein